jgi:hypothetical protein
MQAEKTALAVYKQLKLSTTQRTALHNLWMKWLAAQESNQRAFAMAAKNASHLPTPAIIPVGALVVLNMATEAFAGVVLRRASESWTARMIGASATVTARAAAAVSALRCELNHFSAQYVAMSCAINNAVHGLTVDQTHWLFSTQLDSASSSVDTFRLCQLASGETQHESRRSHCPIA